MPLLTREASEEEVAKPDMVPADHWYIDGREARVLDEGRYLQSQKFLPRLIHELDQRVIKIADEHRRNFVTIEVMDSEGRLAGFYSVFFTVTKERKRRLLLRVQSAYLRPKITQREKEKRRVRLSTLLQRVLEGKDIQP